MIVLSLQGWALKAFIYKQFKYHLILVLKILFFATLTWNSTTMFFVPTSSVTLSNSDDEWYEAKLARRCAEMEALLCQQEEKERLECQAWKEAKIAE